MSSVLNRKKKKLQPLGYEEGIHIYNQQKVRALNYATEMASKSFLDTKLISYQILHDKFGFGLKRIRRLEDKINDLLDGEVSCNELEHYLSKKKGIDLTNVDVPQRELLGFQEIAYDNSILPLKNKIRIIAGSVSDYIVLSVTALKTIFNFSRRQIMEYIDWIVYYINTLSNVKQFNLRMRDIAETLMEECKYCDSRFVAG